MLECLELATVIGEKRDIDVLQLNLRRELRRRDLAPADVYDLATTLLSELAYLTGHAAFPALAGMNRCSPR